MTMNALGRPPLVEVPPFYQGYLEKAAGDDLFGVLRYASGSFHEVMAAVPEERAGHRYAEGKWSIKQVVRHITDCERIFAYRALCFARGDTTPLPGFDEDHYAMHDHAHGSTLAELGAEHDAVRAATITLFQGFSPPMLMRSGIANGRSFTVRALGWTIAGHALHHVHVLRQRYLDHG